MFRIKTEHVSERATETCGSRTCRRSKYTQYMDHINQLDFSDWIAFSSSDLLDRFYIIQGVPHSFPKWTILHTKLSGFPHFLGRDSGFCRNILGILGQVNHREKSWKPFNIILQLYRIELYRIEKK